jgi:hypothetical protein
MDEDSWQLSQTKWPSSQLQFASAFFPQMAQRSGRVSEK